MDAITGANTKTGTLSVAVVTDKPSYVNRTIAYLTATVTDGTNPVSGAAAHMDLMTSKGNLVSSDTTTDANGIARFQYTVNSSRGTGTYSAKVTASKAGFTSNFGTKSFIVTR